MKRLSVFFSSRKSWTLPYIIFSAIFVAIPLLLIVVYAFTDDSGHLTLENFAKFFQHHEAINTFVYSIGIAIITTIVCILLGYPAAWILSNAKPEPLENDGRIVYSSHVGQHLGTYVGNSSPVRLLQCPVG